MRYSAEKKKIVGKSETEGTPLRWSHTSPGITCSARASSTSWTVSKVLVNWMWRPETIQMWVSSTVCPNESVQIIEWSADIRIETLRRILKATKATNSFLSHSGVRQSQFEACSKHFVWKVTVFFLNTAWDDLPRPNRQQARCLTSNDFFP